MPHFITAPKKVAVWTLSIFVVLISTAVTAQLPAVCEGVCALAWSPVDEHLLGAVDESGLWLYDIGDSLSTPILFPYENAISLSFAPDGSTIAVASCFGEEFYNCNSRLSLFDLETQLWEQLAEYDYRIDNIKFTPDGEYVAFQKYGRGRGIQLIDLTSRDTISVADRLTNFVIEYAFDPQSNYIAISNGDRGYAGHVFFGISVWRLADQRLLAFTEELGLLAANLVFTADEREIMFVKYDTQVSVWNFQTGVVSEPRRYFETIPDHLHRLSFSQDSAYLLAALFPNRDIRTRLLTMWDIQTGEQVLYTELTEARFTDLSITVNTTGEYIAFSSRSYQPKTIYIWNQATSALSQLELSE